MPVFDFLKRLITGNKEGNEEETMHDESPFPVTSIRETAPIREMRYRVASCQSSGRGRSHNEDTLLTLNTFIAGVNAPITFGINLVADGMGGHQSGEVASYLAAKGAGQFLIERIFNPAVFERKEFKDENLRQLLKEAVDTAQALIQKTVPGGGTTLTLILLLDDRIFSAHVGDSRLYFLDTDGKFTVKTKDHSLVKRLVDLGQITEQEADVHPQRNVLYRALGQAEPFEADVDQHSLSVGERLMICSDGLWGPVSLTKMKEIFASTDDLNQIGFQLVKAANDAGGPDNISVVLIERIR